MDLRKLPPAMVLTLGLTNCTTTSTCLSYDPTSADTEATGSTGAASSSTGSVGESTVGPCLGATEPETEGTTSGSSGSSSGDGTSSDGGSDTGGDSSSGGALDEPPSAEHTRQQALRRVLSRGILPADVAASLRNRDGEG